MLALFLSFLPLKKNFDERTHLLFLREINMSDALDVVDGGRENGLESRPVMLPPGALISFATCPGGYQTCVGYGG
jgi:hypothetical protein